MWDETKREAIANMYRANGQDVPRHLLPDLETNEWRRYELEKENIPLVSQDEYDAIMRMKE